MEKFLDVNEWKEFSVKELGFVCHHGQRLNQSERKDGPIPFVTAGFQNHGVTQYISNDRPTYHKAITVDMFGNCFFQTDDCAGDDNVYFFVNDKLTDCSKLFVSACITRVTSKKFSYTKQFRQHDANILKVFLPVTPSGDPDWDYMDSFMGKILEEEESAAEQLVALAPEDTEKGHFLDVSGWKAFRIGDLFEKLSLGFKANRKFDKALDVDTKPSDEFDLPLVNAKDGNNGIMYWGRSVDWDSAEMTLDIVMDGAVSAGNVYAQPQHTGVLYNAYLIKPFCSMSASCLQFVSTVMQSAIKEHFGYMNKCTWDRVSTLPICLPVTSDGQPNWAWMEQYMQQQMDKVEPLSEHLSQII